MKRLEGKVALISGGAKGQGAEEVSLFASEGAQVISVSYTHLTLPTILLV
mgnify:CR=1 FL=1